MMSLNEYLTSNQKDVLRRSQMIVVDEYSSENFDLFLTVSKENSIFPYYMWTIPQIGIHNKYGDSTNFANQNSKVTPAIDMKDARIINSKIREWISKYGELLFASMDKNKMPKYIRLALAMNKDINVNKKGDMYGNEIYSLTFK